MPAQAVRRCFVGWEQEGSERKEPDPNLGFGLLQMDQTPHTPSQLFGHGLISEHYETSPCAAVVTQEDDQDVPNSWVGLSSGHREDRIRCS